MAPTTFSAGETNALYPFRGVGYGMLSQGDISMQTTIFLPIKRGGVGIDFFQAIDESFLSQADQCSDST